MKKTFLIILLVVSIFVVNSVVFAADRTNFTIKNIQNTTDIIEYNYDIHIDNVKGAVQITNGTEEDYVVFDYDGNTSITVKSNTDLILMNIPKGGNYNLTVKEVPNYRIKIEDLDFTTYKGIISTDSFITVNSYSLKRNNSKVVIPSENKKEEKKENPSTGDHIALLGLLALFTILFIYIITHKNIPRYEDNW